MAAVDRDEKSGRSLRPPLDFGRDLEPERVQPDEASGVVLVVGFGGVGFHGGDGGVRSSPSGCGQPSSNAVPHGVLFDVEPDLRSWRRGWRR